MGDGGRGGVADDARVDAAYALAAAAELVGQARRCVDVLCKCCAGASLTLLALWVPQRARALGTSRRVRAGAL